MAPTTTSWSRSGRRRNLAYTFNNSDRRVSDYRPGLTSNPTDGVQHTDRSILGRLAHFSTDGACAAQSVYR